VFHIHGVDKHGRTVLSKRVSRKQLSAMMANLGPCRVGMESCSGSNYWSRCFAAQGHDVRLMAAQFVKAYVKSNKNDRVDAETMCEAVQRPTMRLVRPKTVEQQDLQSLHRVRTRLVGQRTALAYQMRGLLAEYGVVVAKGLGDLRKRLPEVLEDADNELTSLTREVARVAQMDKKIARSFTRSEACQRLARIEGIGPVTATALVSSVGAARAYRNGREMAAWLGLVPRQHSTGGKPRLLGISKRGDRYTRKLLIHGARAVVKHAAKKSDRRSTWISALAARRGTNIASVALANKNARIAWAMLAREQEYRKAS
jgi:transposase